jgi:hypothetical protein
MIQWTAVVPYESMEKALMTVRIRTARSTVCWFLTLVLVPALHAGEPGSVRLIRTPHDGIQPQLAVDEQGTVHLIYYNGDAGGGDVYYVRSEDEGTTFSEPVRVNSQPGSAVAAGTIRGAQIAVGKGNRVHVAWNGSSKARPKGPRNPAQPADSPYNGLPMLYTHMNDAGAGFEPQRNLMQKTFALDGGGAVAADPEGNVYVAWHGASLDSSQGEAGRRVWIARSDDEGKTFAAEEPAYNRPTGACGCCGMQIFADSHGATYVLYRSATEEVNRDIYLLTSTSGAERYRGTPLQRWQVQQCPMSSMAFAEGQQGVLGAWETTGQVYYGIVEPRTGEVSEPIAAPGRPAGRKHPRLAAAADGTTLMVWTEGTGWNKGGSLAWQVFDKTGKALKERGRADGIPVWSFAAAFARADGGFTIVY